MSPFSCVWFSIHKYLFKQNLYDALLLLEKTSCMNSIVKA